jgi:radical SAM superfamily enzyme YgiQ (UPF0313 family)
MRVVVVVVWRPKNYPTWNGRSSAGALGIPRALAADAGAAPYTGIHLASLFPRDWEVTLVHEMVRDVDLDADVDAAFLSTMDFCAPHARVLAQEFRARGVKVVIGGLCPTLNPEYFQDVADAVVVGEAEPVMASLIADLRSGRLARLYRAEKPADLSELPVPRYDLVEPAFKMTMPYEATRGCPYACSFCVLSAIRQPYRRRPIANVLRDLRAIPSGWNWRQRHYLVFWDNNLGADRRYFRDLCEALTPLKRVWGTETSIDTITPESARLMGRAGCRLVYIGLESLSQESLRSSNKRHNRVHEYRQRLGYLHDNGVLVMSIFLLGLDGDGVEYLGDLPNLVHDVGVDVPVFSFAAPIEGTPFHRELRDSGRLLEGDIFGAMDGVHLAYRPRDVSPDELEFALFECMRRAYRPVRVARRIGRGLRAGFWGGLVNASANLGYMSFQRSLARVGLHRVQARGPWPGSSRERSTPHQTSPTEASNSGQGSRWRTQK